MSQKDNAKYVITSSTELKRWVKFRDIALTALIWIAYIYFMRDFFMFCRDTVVWGLQGFHDTDPHPDFAIVGTIFNYLETIGLLGGAYIGWAIYNLVRFRGRQRRKSPPPVLPEDLARFYELTADDVRRWQGCSNITMFHDHLGYLVEVRPNGIVPAPQAAQ